MNDALLRFVPFDSASPYFEAIITLCQRVWEHDQPQIGRHANYPGFRGRAALNALGTLAGYVYGTTALDGQWWPDRLTTVLGRELAERYIIGSFAVTELAVAPEYRRHGIGTHLMRAVLADLPHSRATLSTECDNTPARALYEALGFSYLAERLQLSDGGDDYVVMHRSLPLTSSTGALPPAE